MDARRIFDLIMIAIVLAFLLTILTIFGISGILEGFSLFSIFLCNVFISGIVVAFVVFIYKSNKQH